MIYCILHLNKKNAMDFTTLACLYVYKMACIFLLPTKNTGFSMTLAVGKNVKAIC